MRGLPHVRGDDDLTVIATLSTLTRRPPGSEVAAGRVHHGGAGLRQSAVAATRGEHWTPRESLL